MNAKEFRVEQSKITEQLNVLKVAQGNLKDELIDEIKSYVDFRIHLDQDLEYRSPYSNHPTYDKFLVLIENGVLFFGTNVIQDLTFTSLVKILERLESAEYTKVSEEEWDAFKEWSELNK